MNLFELDCSTHKYLALEESYMPITTQIQKGDSWNGSFSFLIQFKSFDHKLKQNKMLLCKLHKCNVKIFNETIIQIRIKSSYKNTKNIGIWLKINDQTNEVFLFHSTEIESIHKWILLQYTIPLELKNCNIVEFGVVCSFELNELNILRISEIKIWDIKGEFELQVSALLNNPMPIKIKLNEKTNVISWEIPNEFHLLVNAWVDHWEIFSGDMDWIGSCFSCCYVFNALQKSNIKIFGVDKIGRYFETIKE